MDGAPVIAISFWFVDTLHDLHGLLDGFRSWRHAGIRRCLRRCLVQLDPVLRRLRRADINP